MPSTRTKIGIAALVLALGVVFLLPESKEPQIKLANLPDIPLSIERVDYTTKIITESDGTKKLLAHPYPVHYLENSELADVDRTFVDTGNRWEMTKHNYQLRVAKDFSAPLLIQYRNVFDGADHTITYEPFALAWYNHQTDDVQIFRSQQAVQGVVNGNSVYYENAFGAGIDFEITLGQTGFTKEVVIPNEPANYPTPPGAGYRMVALFKYGGNGVTVLNSERQAWDGESHFESGDGFEIFDGTKSSFIRPAYAKDALGRSMPLRVMWRKRNSQLWQMKEVPIDKLQNAEFPVRFDTVTEYTFDSTNTKYVAQDAVSVWATARNATTGTLYTWSTTGNDNVTVAGFLAGNYYIRRGGIVFDSSALPDTATISAVRVGLGTASTGSFDVDGLDVDAFDLTNNVNVNLPLQSEDYDDFGSTPIGSEDLTTFNNTGTIDYITITDFTVVNKTGNTHIGFRLSADTDNTTPSGYNTLRINDDNGAHVLEVTYTEEESEPTVTPTTSVSGNTSFIGNTVIQ